MRIDIDDNFYIRSIELEDAVSTYHLIRDNEVHLSKWLSWVKNTDSTDGRKKYIKKGM